MISGLALPTRHEREVLGHLFEERFFESKPLKPFDPGTVRRRDERPTFQESLAEVIRLQRRFPSWNPVRPKAPQAKKLFCAVRPNLPPYLREELRLCCALGTTLDHEYGADGVFILRSNPEVPITFDLALSRSQRKMDTLKANGIITPDDVSHNKRAIRIGRIIARYLVGAHEKGWGVVMRKLWW